MASAGTYQVLASVVEVRPNGANLSCPKIVSDQSKIKRTPCKVLVDEDLASSINNKVVRRAGLTELPDTDRMTRMTTREMLLVILGLL